MMSYQTFLKKVAALPRYVLEVGIFVEKNERKKETVEIEVINPKTGKKTIRKEKKVPGVTNAEILYINENGSPAQHIPKRPILQMTVDYVKANWLQDEIVKALGVYISSGCNQDALEKELNKFAIRIQNYCRKLIYDNKLTPRNSPTTIAKKGVDHPLFDTGQLARSIQCRVIKK